MNPAPRRLSARGATAGLIIVIAAAAAVVAGLVVDHVTVTSRSALARVDLGRPLPWWRQDQSSLSPPSLPERASALSPLEHPVDVLALPLLLDLGLAAVLVAALALVLVAVGRGLRAVTMRRSSTTLRA